MATVGLNIDFQLGSNGTPTTEVDLSTKVKTADMTRNQDLPDVTAFNGNGARAFAAGLTEGSFDMEFFWDTTIDGHLNGLIGYTTAVEFIYGPDGTTSTRPKYTGTVFLESLTVPATIGDVKVFQATFKVTGAIVRTTY
jgi:hypothetical protein